jgi:light-regulated signal transduction histidine kinase (bacteriophytochrome)
VSHDLRAPLRAILGFCRAITTDLGERLGETGRGQFDRVVANAQRMSALIDGMLALARVTRTPVAMRPLDLSGLARDVARELAAADPARTVEVVIHDGLTAKGDPTLVRAVVTNLMANAWKFTAKRAAARIEVGSAPAESGPRAFFVRDNGAGFDVKHAQHLFGAFRRLHREEDFAGHGIGLATVERIVTRHGGRVWAEGKVDDGAVFYFTLPEA